MSFNPDKLKKFLSKKKGAQTGGRGTVRRKAAAASRTRGGGVQEDKKLRSALNRIGVREIAQVEAVDMFKDDNEVIHFERPKVEAAIQSNTYVVSGKTEIRTAEQMLPDLLKQLGAADPAVLQQLAASGGLGGPMGSPGMEDEDEDDDDDEVPDLVDTFDTAAVVEEDKE